MPGVPVAGRATVLDAILPDWVESAEAFGDGDAVLLPDEDAVLAGAAPRRRAECATARACARAAMARLGLPAVPILPGPAGAPRWPDGVVGSMTHCDGYRAAAVAPAADAAAIGIDAEPNAPLPAGVLDSISLPAERARLARLAAADRDLCRDVCWDRLLFTAKEAVYKAWYPLTHRWLDFEQAAVTVTAGARQGSFVARLLAGAEPPVVGGRPLGEFRGRWTVRRGIVASAVVVPAAARRRVAVSEACAGRAAAAAAAPAGGRAGWR